MLIKRIVGMPGDTVSLQAGAVYINGRRLAEPYVRRIAGRPEPSDPFDNGLPWALQQPYHVPAGSYFMMGDNRTDSGDSRALARSLATGSWGAPSFGTGRRDGSTRFPNPPGTGAANPRQRSRPRPASAGPSFPHPRLPGQVPSYD